MSRFPLPRELVLASAGTGKTYRLSSRIIGLVHEGAAPEEVLAATFTRKAAGEILDRVLARVAEAAVDERKAAEVEREALLERAAGAGDDGFGPADALTLLELLVPRLHRFEVGTLDSVFVRACRSFWPELELPPGWRIGDEPTAERLRSEALQDVLAEGSAEEQVELVRMLVRGSASRRIHGRLMDQVAGLHALWRRLDPEAEAPWSPFRGRKAPDDPEVAREALIARVREAALPENSSGEPHGNWVSARETLVEELREGDWEQVLDGGLGAGAVQEGFEYYNLGPTAELEACYEEIRRLAAAEVGPALQAQARALGRLAERFDLAHERRQRREGAYRFRDLTHRVATGPEGLVHGELDYRLDRRVDHLLLDEFQDTSPAQWEALRPLADRLARRPAEESATVVVADPKQSIYGWRDADPALAARVGDRYGLERDRLETSWRSSPVVLDFVNDLFGDLPANPVLAEMERGTEVAVGWSEAFAPHRPAPPREEDAGHVRLEVGPEGGARGTAPPRMMAFAAERVLELRERAPRATVGVLTRTNDAVAAVIRELAERGVAASEEGGVSVSRSAPAAAVLSLLRMADHPGDRVSRYHVAHTPVGEPLGYRDHRDDPGAARAARHVRGRLLRHGYGETLADWRRELAPDLSARQDRRLRQLVELGYRWDGRATLRATDFVRFAEAERAEEPSGAAVRVMTVHQAKGLEFDAVVLPELDVPLTGWGAPAFLPEHDPDSGRVVRVFPYVNKLLRPLFPEMAGAMRQHREATLRDALSLLYVAVTRARREVQVLVSASTTTGSSSASRSSRVVLGAFGLEDAEAGEGERLLERGDPGWGRELEAEVAEEAVEPAPGERGPLRIDPDRSLGRMLPHRTPSDLEGRDGGLLEVLSPERREARAAGTVVHEWLRRTRWIEDGLPEEEALREVARREAPSLEEERLRDLLSAFRGWMEADEVRAATSRQRALERARERTGSEAASVEVETEWPFLCEEGGEVLAGQVDRLVLVREGERAPAGEDGSPPVAAEVVDFKTDDLDPVASQLQAAVDRYRPQLEEYVKAVATLHGIPPERVTARLVFLSAGRTVEL